MVRSDYIISSELISISCTDFIEDFTCQAAYDCKLSGWVFPVWDYKPNFAYNVDSVKYLAQAQFTTPQTHQALTCPLVNRAQKISSKLIPDQWANKSNEPKLRSKHSPNIKRIRSLEPSLVRIKWARNSVPTPKISPNFKWAQISVSSPVQMLNGPNI